MHHSCGAGTHAIASYAQAGRAPALQCWLHAAILSSKPEKSQEMHQPSCATVKQNSHRKGCRCEHADCCVLQIMVPGKTNVSLTLSWSTDYDPIAAAEQPGAAKQGPKGDADSEVMLLVLKEAALPCQLQT